MRTIKRYANRKLYDVQESHYVTLDKLASLVRQGEEIRVVDHVAGRDLTAATLAQIIFEEEKRGAGPPAADLCRIITTGQIP